MKTVKTVKCGICGGSLNINNLHPDSDRVPTDSQFAVYHVGCANNEDCYGGGNMDSADLEDDRAWIKLR